MGVEITQRRFVALKSHPQGMPSQENFALLEDTLPETPAGEFLVKNEWISVDPYMRGRMREDESYIEPFELGKPIEGGCIGIVIESRHPRFVEGQHVLGQHGWCDHWLSNGDGVKRVDSDVAPVQAWLSILGMTGLTAYVGLTKIAKLQEGETVFVSAASGAVGSVACQIAKIRKCRVIGSAGSSEKIEWLQSSAQVDAAFNYRETEDISNTLAHLAPDGLDVYFDNVGGDHLAAALNCMKNFGRIVCCGMISGYNDVSPQPGPANLFRLIGKRLLMQGFIVRDHADLEPEFQRCMSEWIANHQIVWQETVTEGIETLPDAFLNLFHGNKMGKTLVRV